MATVIGVRFRNAGKLYYFDPGKLWPTAGDAVIVETVRGMEYGEVVRLSGRDARLVLTMKFSLQRIVSSVSVQPCFTTRPSTKMIQFNDNKKET